MAVEPAPSAPAGSMTEPAVLVGSDTGLVQELIGGSHDALAALYDRHGGAVYATAMRVTRDPSIASEVVQETFLALWDRAERFDPTRGSLPGWLATIARNRAVDHLRAAGRHQRAATFSSFAAFGQGDEDDNATVEWLTSSGVLIGSAEPELAPELALTGKETREAIQDAVASLDPNERSVIELAYAGGMTQAEIAAHLGWPLGTVKTRTKRALRRLRDRLEPPPAAVRAAASPCGPAFGVPCH